MAFAGGSFTGNGSGLTNLNASQLTSIGNNNGNLGNFFVGPAGDPWMSGINNTAYGSASFSINFIGSYNTAIGSWALSGTESASNNIALGYQAGYLITTGSSNIDIGNVGAATDSNIIRIGSGQIQTFIAGVINGNGGGLTNLNASQLSSGTISVAQLPLGIAYLTPNQTFLGSQNFVGGLTATNGVNSFAGNGGGLTNLSAAQLTGVVPLAQIPAAVVTNNEAGLSLAGAFSGNGGGLTNLNASQLNSGTMPLAQLPLPVLMQTNFIDGQRYTNNYGWPLMIEATIVLNTAAVAGSANESFCIQASPTVGGFTNICAISTLTTSAALHYTNHISGFVPTNSIYWFTNLSTGTGNSAAVNGGQIKYP